MHTSIDRYQHDPVFRALVDSLTFQIGQGNYTPTEVREAAMLAQINFENSYLKKIYISDVESIRNLNKEVKNKE